MPLYRCDLADERGQIRLGVRLNCDTDKAAIELGRQILALWSHYAKFRLWESGQLIHSEGRQPAGAPAIPVSGDHATRGVSGDEPMLASRDNLVDLARRYPESAGAGQCELKPWQIAWIVWWQFIGQRKAGLLSSRTRDEGGVAASDHRPE
jgi:hypothetical protein